VYAARSQKGSNNGSVNSSVTSLHRSATSNDDVITEDITTSTMAQIASIMSSNIRQMNTSAMYATKEFEETFWKIMTGSDLPRDISTWLSALGLPQYLEILRQNGYDNVDFLSDGVLEEDDMISIGIIDSKHRRRLLESAQNLPKIRCHSHTTIGDWLKSLHLSQYEERFHNLGYSTVDSLRNMNISQLKLIITKRGHHKRALASLTRHNINTDNVGTVHSKSCSDSSGAFPNSTISSSSSNNCEKKAGSKQIVRRTSAPTSTSHCNKSQQVKPHHCHQSSLPLSLEGAVVYDTPRVTSPTKEKKKGEIKKKRKED